MENDSPKSELKRTHWHVNTFRVHKLQPREEESFINHRTDSQKVLIRRKTSFGFHCAISLNKLMFIWRRAIRFIQRKVSRKKVTTAACTPSLNFHGSGDGLKVMSCCEAFNWLWLLCYVVMDDPLDTSELLHLRFSISLTNFYKIFTTKYQRWLFLWLQLKLIFLITSM